MSSQTNIKVAVRIRPKLHREEADRANICTQVTPGEPQILLGVDKAFTFDNVFDMGSKQFEVYDACVNELVNGCFEGFNATVIAYGQTGSGKTFTMGTGFDITFPEEKKGIIPRAVEHLFDEIRKRQDDAIRYGQRPPEFTITTQFIEIYNEELFDLLSDVRRKGNNNNNIRIHEDFNKGISLIGAVTKKVSTAQETLDCLRAGSLFRTTGSTLMNSESSRSHAIFTIFIKQTRVVPSDNDDAPEVVTLTAKFNFVDLAGSERLSRTGAVGERAREGICINAGLLHLGNVIAALSDRTGKVTHIPYRDSKLTRVLQDSLGGNSVTIMIACISPCDKDFLETLNTLRYANRAKNIKNKVVANQDSQSQLINELRRQLLNAQLEIQELKQGKLLVRSDGEVEHNDIYFENQALQNQLNNANVRIKALTARIEVLEHENIAKVLESHMVEGSDDGTQSLIKGYLEEINKLRTTVVESEHVIEQYRKQLNLQKEQIVDDENIDIVERARQELELGKSELMRLNTSAINTGNMSGSDTNGNRFSDESDVENVDEDFEQELAGHKVELNLLMEMLASKEKLIEECEAREKRIKELTEHYEQKITCFKCQIKQVEDERDLLMKKKKKDSKESTEAKSKREEMEKKLAELQKSLKKFESLQKEHQKVLAQEASSKEMLNKARQELIQEKQQRVKVILQMKETVARHHKELQKNRMMLNKLTREDNKKGVTINNLQAQSSQQKRLLKRREEEIKALKKMVRPPMSNRVAGRFLKRNPNGKTPKKLRDKWSLIEQRFNKVVAQKLQYDSTEKKLERFTNDRQKLIDVLNTVNEDTDDKDYIDSIYQNIKYFDKCIKELHEMILHLEEENVNVEQFFESWNPDEVCYIMDKLVNSNINYAITVSQREEELKEKDARFRSIVELMNQNQRKDVINFMLEHNLSLNDQGAIEISPDEAQLLITGQTNDKFRRLTMTPAELLYQIDPPSNRHSLTMSSGLENGTAESGVKNGENENEMATELVETTSNNNSNKKDTTFIVNENALNSTQMTTSCTMAGNLNIRGNQVITHSSSASSLKELNNLSGSGSGSVSGCSSGKITDHYLLSPHLMRRRGGGHISNHSPIKARMTRSTSNNEHYQRQNSGSGNSHQNDLNFPYYFQDQMLEHDRQQYYSPPPGSPSIRRRHSSRETGPMNLLSESPEGSAGNDVFTRLTGSNSVTSQTDNFIGRIMVNPSKTDKSFILEKTHTIVGHRRSVLTVTATNEVLFTGSKDGSAKIWDLNQCTEVFCMNDHPDAVNVVRYDEYNKLIFTCSKAIIKIWDPRQHPIRCVRALCSSGLVSENSSESTICDIRLSADGSTLFSTNDRLVRVWDLNTFQSIGKLNTGHKSIVTCLAVDDDEMSDSRLVITGSKDHTVKVFELEHNVAGIHIPKFTLKPPHYDGIEALQFMDKGRTLFSSGRDGCIKKWSLSDQRCVASLGNCHRDWVLALDTFYNDKILLSGCRGGVLRAWDAETCRPYGEVQAHDAAIHDIATISQAAFTASADGTIHLWQHHQGQSSPIDQIAE